MSRYAGRYELVGLLGVGGMGSVYRVKDRVLDDEVALKILRKDLSESQLSVARFHREVKLARQINHSNVVRIFDVGCFEGEHYYTMECIAGDVVSALSNGQPMDVGAALDVAIQIADGLAAVHAAGVVHRDLKPENVMVAPDGRVVITDFGVAISRDEPGTAPLPMLGAGTPLYMSPEQIEGRALDERTDLYALGLMIFEMVTGSTPWGRGTDKQRQLARLSVPAASIRSIVPDAPESLSGLVARMLAREPADRVRDAETAARSLRECREELKGSRLSAPPPSKSSTPLGLAIPVIATTGMPHVRSVAVLPVRNLGAGEDNYLAEDMTLAMIDRLATCPGIRVASRRALRLDDGSDALRVGRQANVDVVVEATVHKRPTGVLRVRVRMVEMERGFVLWTRRFERPTKELFDLQAEINQELARTLTVEMHGRQNRGPANRDNVDAYVRARRAHAEWMPAASETALDLLGEALLISPDDPMLLADKALVQLRLWHIDPHAPAGLGSSALQLAHRALEQTPNLGEAHLAIGLHALLQANWLLAARRFEEAVRCNPAIPDAHAHLGMMRCWAGEIEQGMRELGVALRLDPENRSALWTAALTHGLTGNPQQAYELLDRADFFVEDHPATLGARVRIAIWNGDRQMLAATHAAALSTRFPSGHLETSLARLFLDPEPDNEIGALTAYAAAPEAPPYCRGQVMQAVAERTAMGGMLEDAWSALRAAAPNSMDATWFQRCPAIARLSRKPAFLTLRAQVAARAENVFAPFESPSGVV